MAAGPASGMRCSGRIQMWERTDPVFRCGYGICGGPGDRGGLKAFLDTTVLGYANATDSYKGSGVRLDEKRHNWDAKPEWILPSHGVVDAFFSAIKCVYK